MCFIHRCACFYFSFVSLPPIQINIIHYHLFNSTILLHFTLEYTKYSFITCFTNNLRIASQSNNSIPKGKENVVSLKVKDDVKYGKSKSQEFILFFLALMHAGLITTIVASPIDVVKTRLMNSRSKTYTGMINCAQKMLFKEGISSFYKGYANIHNTMYKHNIMLMSNTCFKLTLFRMGF